MCPETSPTCGGNKALGSNLAPGSHDVGRVIAAPPQTSPVTLGMARSPVCTGGASGGRYNSVKDRRGMRFWGQLRISERGREVSGESGGTMPSGQACLGAAGNHPVPPLAGAGEQRHLAESPPLPPRRETGGGGYNEPNGETSYI